MDPEVRAAIEASVAKIRESPRDPARWIRLGMVYHAHALTDPARDCYAHAVAADGADAHWWYLLAIAQEQLGDVAGALQSLDRVAERSRYAPAHWRQGLLRLDEADLEGALTAFERAAAVDSADPTPQLGMARIALQKREPDLAIGIIQKLVSRPQPLPLSTVRYAWHLLSDAYRQSGRFDEARSLAQLASGAEPARHDPWADEILEHRKGYLWVLKEARERVVSGQLETAVGLLERLRRDRPNDVALMNELATVYSSAARLEEALAILGQALAADPEGFETHANLASVHLGRGNLERALTHADRAVRLNPRYARAHEVRGAILWRAGRPSEALGGFETAVRYDPANVIALVSAGMVQGSLGRLDAALVHLQRALELEPTHVDALVGLAMVMMKLRRLDDAEAALQRANLLHPANPRVTATRTQLRVMRAEAK
jgi:tetratricopeptide (TPR) repeat protein